MSSIVILSGPLGAGKTAVAQAIVAASPTPPAYIEGDTFWSFFPTGTRPGPKSFRVIMASMMAAAVPYAVAGHTVLVDFSVPPWFLDSARAIAAMRSIPLDYVVLLPSEAACAARAAARPEGRIVDYAPYRDLYAEFAQVERHIVSDDAASATELAIQIRQKLDAGSFRL